MQKEEENNNNNNTTNADACCGKKNCQSRSDLFVWVMPDPYYGYGHHACLRCEDHPREFPLWKSHEYDPDFDDAFLGLRKYDLFFHPWLLNHGTIYCFDLTCNRKGEPLDTSRKVGYEVEPSDNFTGEKRYFCMECLRKNKGKYLENRSAK